MRIGIYDPYLDTLGGGEKYILTAAECLSITNQVEIFWDNDTILSRAQERFNINLTQVKSSPNLFGPKENLINRIQKSREYDLIIYLSDGSIPYLLSEKVVLLLQHPMNWVNGRSLINKIKFSNIQEIICYSQFVKGYLDKNFPIPAKVIYPPIEPIGYSESDKKNVILSVGRFTKAMNAKKQDVLIDAFKRICQRGIHNWELLLVGSYLPEDQDFYEEMQRLAQGYPIRIIGNAPYSDLMHYYKQAKVYWHAAGFSEDLQHYPERSEHFGITTVEAMSAGAVPIVINAGGQREIVINGTSGYVWDTTAVLESKTMEIMANDQVRIAFATNASKRAQSFGIDQFTKAITSLASNPVT